MSMKKWGGVGYFVFAILVMFGFFSSNADAEMTTSFHGLFESNLVIRDINGMQYGFFDEAYGVQQRNTLKFDVDVYPDIQWGSFSVEKIHLTYRGAYDSIFDLRAHAFNIRDNIGLSRFDYGLRDIRFENDLREAFIDLAYKGDLGDGFFRPGRQIVSWGEGLLETLNDVINPPDMSYNLFFQNPDDVKTPLWMGRINYSIPSMSGFGLNFDLLWVPDIRPTQNGPLDGVARNPKAGFQAPFVSITPFADLKGFSVRERVPTNENEYGAKVSAAIGERLNVSVLYFRDVVSDPNGLKLYLRTNQAEVTHNKQHVYGGFFSYQFLVGSFEAIIRGEISRYTAYPISLANPRVNPATFEATAFLLKPVTKTTLAVDKDLRLRWLSKDLTKVTFEWLHKVINEWDNVLDDPQIDKTGRVTGRIGAVKKDRRNIREADAFSFQTSTAWFGSKVTPSILLACSPGKHGDGTTWMLKPGIKWAVTPNMYTDLRMQAFLGDANASYGFADGIKVASEVTLRLGYEW